MSWNRKHLLDIESLSPEEIVTVLVGGPIELRRPSDLAQDLRRIVDESERAARIVRDLLATCRALAEAGQTILVVEQNISAAMTLADRIYVLNNGHMVEELAAPMVRATPVMPAAAARSSGLTTAIV